MKQNSKAQLGCNTQSQSMELGALITEDTAAFPPPRHLHQHHVFITRKPGLIPDLKVFTDENPKFVLESCGSSAHCCSLLMDLV